MSVEMAAVSIFKITGLVLTPVLPLALAAALWPRAWRRRVIRIAPWAALPALVLAVVGPGMLLDLPWLFLGARLGVDHVGQVFLLFTATLWLVAGIYAQASLAGDLGRSRFFAFYLLTMSGNLGLIVAQDALSFYLFFALMSFSAYGLIVHKGNSQALRAGRVYILLVVVGEMLLFAGLVMGTWQADSLSIDEFSKTAQGDLVLGLLLAGFGIKAGALPLHVWLPLAHPAAPTPASAVLSGAIVKAGLLGWLRFLPLGQVALPEWSALLTAAGLGAAVYGVLVGLFQNEPKTVLAYSTISQMGLITASVGIGMGAPEIWPLCLSFTLILALHHAFAKGALFLGVEVAAATGCATTQRRTVFAGLLVSALALAGLPFTSGAVAKFGLKSLSYHLPAPWPVWTAVLLSLIAVGTTLLMARFLYVVWPRGTVQQQLSAGLVLPWTVLLATSTFFILLWPGVGELGPRTIFFDEFWHALWPVLAGAAGAWLAWTTARKALIQVHIQIPAGDVLSLALWVSLRFRRAWSSLVDRCGHDARGRHLNWQRKIGETRAFRGHLPVETWSLRWDVCGALLLLMLVLFFIILALT